MGLLALRVIIPLISLLLCLSILIICCFISRNKDNLLYSFACFELFIILWSFRLIIQNADIDTKSTQFIIFQYLPNCFVGLSLLVLSLIYTKNRIVKSKLLILLFIPPTAFYILVCTNNLHHLFFIVFENNNVVPGPFYKLHLIESYTYFLIGTLLLIRYSIKQFGSHKTQPIFMFLGSMIILIANISGVVIDNLVFKYKTQISYLLTSFGFTVGSIFYGLSLLKYKFLRVFPIALQEIFNNMEEGIIVIDERDKVIGYNKSFTDKICDSKEIRVNEDISKFIENQENDLEKFIEFQKIQCCLNEDTYQGIISLKLSEGPIQKYYDVNIQLILDNDYKVGKIITFSDVSEYRNLLNEVSEKNKILEDVNKKLLDANKQLKVYTTISEELAITKERNRISRDIHDTLGQTFILIITMMETGIIDITQNSNKAINTYTEAIEIARNGLKEVRNAVKGLSIDKIKTSNINNSLHKLVEDYQKSGLNIEFSTNFSEDFFSKKSFDVIYRTCQEALTNSIRHGAATNVNIVLQHTDECIKLFIADDGCGCVKIDKGVGLTSMEERVNGLNGSIELPRTI